MLTDHELEVAQSLIDAVSEGLYTLPEIYGSKWHAVVAPKKFGQRFKAAVRANRLGGIQWIAEKTTDNKQQYIITA